MTPAPKSAEVRGGEKGALTAVAVVCRQWTYSARERPGRCESSRARAAETIGHAIEVPDIQSYSPLMMVE